MNYALLTLPLIVGTAHATVLAFDNFDYADGDLSTNPGWAIHSGESGTGDELLVSGGKAVVEHGVPDEDLNLAFTPTVDTLFYAVTFSVDDLGAPWAGTDGEYFASFRQDGGFGLAGRLHIDAPAGGGDFSVGISTVNGAPDALWGTDLSYGTDYRAVVSYDQVTDQAVLWIDAALETDTSVTGADETDPGITIGQFALRQSDSSENETVRVDSLVVGTTFEDVVNPVPEPSTTLLGALGLLALARRKR